MHPRTLLPCLLALAACTGSSDGPSPAPDPTDAAGGAVEAPTGPPTLAPPEGWVERAPTSSMRWKEWVLEEGDEPLLVIGHHWPEGVGSLEANLARWRTQVVPAEGGPEPSVSETLRDGLRVTVLDGRGTISGMSGPGEPGQRMLAAFVDAPQGRFPGAYTFKLVGPTERVDAHAEAFQAFLDGL